MLMDTHYSCTALEKDMLEINIKNKEKTELMFLHDLTTADTEKQINEVSQPYFCTNIKDTSWNHFYKLDNQL